MVFTTAWEEGELRDRSLAVEPTWGVETRVETLQFPGPHLHPLSLRVEGVLQVLQIRVLVLDSLPAAQSFTF